MRKSLALCGAILALTAGHASAADLRFSGPGYLPPRLPTAGASALERLLRGP
jgi:hypothetical protein